MILSSNTNNVENSNNQQETQGFDVPKKTYRTIISMIAGSLVGNGNIDVHEACMNQEESPNHDQSEFQRCQIRYHRGN